MGRAHYETGYLFTYLVSYLVIYLVLSLLIFGTDCVTTNRERL